MKGLIFNIERYSIHDGPGIRVTFFMKGCPLSCWWCHNPEGISSDQEIIEHVNKVGDKEFVCKEEAGKYYSVSDIIALLDRERIFIDESGGGVTFSGGEPLMQAEFLAEALKSCRDNGYHTAVDTSGYSEPEIIQEIIPYTSLFLFDVKHMDEKKHIELTGKSNALILSNLNLLLNSGKEINIRIPIVPGFNDDQENLMELRNLLEEAGCENLTKISLLPYHRIGKAKYRRFGITYRMNDTEQPSRERMIQLKDYFSDLDIKIQIGG
jgi:pyruvate formate lyase activating enzyme